MKKRIIVATALIVAAAVGGYIGWKAFFGTDKVVVDADATSEKISEYANPKAFITHDELYKLMNDESADLVIIGAINPATSNTPIEGSFTMWRSDYEAPADAYDFGGMANSTAQMEDILSSYGATPDSTIVVYAANAHHDAARLWWQITMLGHNDVRYLDGGLNAWVGADLPTGNANPKVTPSNYVAPNVNTDILANLDDVILALDTDTVILDTRTAAEEQGETVSSGAFGPGKIANAPWIEWSNALAEDTTMKPLAELEQLYGEFEDQDIITYCQSGVRSAHTLFVLTQALGYDNVKNYDGSWIEWSYEYYEKDNPATLVQNGDK